MSDDEYKPTTREWATGEFSAGRYRTKPIGKFGSEDPNVYYDHEIPKGIFRNVRASIKAFTDEIMRDPSYSAIHPLTQNNPLSQQELSNHFAAVIKHLRNALDPRLRMPRQYEFLCDEVLMLKNLKEHYMDVIARDQLNHHVRLPFMLGTYRMEDMGDDELVQFHQTLVTCAEKIFFDEAVQRLHIPERGLVILVTTAGVFLYCHGHNIKLSYNGFEERDACFGRILVPFIRMRPSGSNRSELLNLVPLVYDTDLRNIAENQSRIDTSEDEVGANTTIAQLMITPPRNVNEIDRIMPASDAGGYFRAYFLAPDIANATRDASVVQFGSNLLFGRLSGYGVVKMTPTTPWRWTTSTLVAGHRDQIESRLSEADRHGEKDVSFGTVGFQFSALDETGELREHACLLYSSRDVMGVVVREDPSGHVYPMSFLDTSSKQRDDYREAYCQTVTTGGDKVLYPSDEHPTETPMIVSVVDGSSIAVLVKHGPTTSIVRDITMRLGVAVDMMNDETLGLDSIPEFGSPFIEVQSDKLRRPKSRVYRLWEKEE